MCYIYIAFKMFYALLVIMIRVAVVPTPTHTHTRIMTSMYLNLDP